MKHKLGILLFLLILVAVNSDPQNLTTEFSQFNQTVTYGSLTNSSSRGMSPFYGFANFILDIMVGDDLIPDGYLIVENGEIISGPKADNGDWGELLSVYWGIIAVLLITALIFVLMPFVGCCFCCCRSGGHDDIYNSKRDTCSTICWSVLLIITLVALILGVAATFASNQYLQNGVDGLTESVEVATDDALLFFEATSNEINHLLVNNYDELMSSLNVVLDSTSETVINEFANKSNAVSLEQLNDFVTSLPEVESDLGFISDSITDLRIKASQLTDGLRGVKRELLVTLAKCSVPVCIDFLNNYPIGQLDASGIDYNQLPDDKITLIRIDVQNMVAGDVIPSVEEVEKGLKNVLDQLESDINGNVLIVRDSLIEAGTEIKNVADDVTTQFTKISDTIKTNTHDNYDTADCYIREYGIYRLWFGVVISCILLLVVLFLIIGLVWGICAPRPSGYDDCCTKSTGSTFLMTAVTIIFVTISVLSLVCLVHFIVGLIAKRMVCDPLRNPENNKLFTDYIDKIVDLNDFLYDNSSLPEAGDDLEPFTISNVIVECHQHKSIYQVLRLENFINISEISNYLEEFDIEKNIAELVDINIDNTTFFSNDFYTALDRLVNSELDNFDADQFTLILSDDITHYDLTDLSNTLNQTADNIPKIDADTAALKISLHTQAQHLATYQEKLVIPMTKVAQDLIARATKLDIQLKAGHNSFGEAMQELKIEIQDSEKFMKDNATEFAKTVVDELLSGFVYEIETYLNMIVTSVQKNIGPCEPLANIYDAILVAGCDNIVDPLNGFWIGIGWSIAIFLITIIICAKLATLYHKSAPYEYDGTTYM